jgi:hypothetical protein
MKTNLLAPNDHDLLNDVLLQLESDPRISSRDVAIAVKNGVVTLSGFVRSYGEKFLAENMVKAFTASDPWPMICKLNKGCGVPIRRLREMLCKDFSSKSTCPATRSWSRWKTPG